MSFTDNTKEKFSTVYTKSFWKTKDPIVKCNYVAKGKNLIFGASNNFQETSRLVYIGKVIESSASVSYLAADCWLDIAFPHVIYITGTRGTGKSFDLGVFFSCNC